MLRALALALVVLTCSLPVIARAQRSTVDADDGADMDDQARDAFAAGRTALADGRTEDALVSFRRAYRLSGRPQLLYNIGLVEDRLRHDRPALEAFESYLEAVPDAENRASVEERIRTLRDEIAHDDAITAALAAQSAPQDSAHEDLATSPVLWVIVGVVVVGAAVGIGLGVGLSQDPGTAPPVPGPSGVVVSALSW